MPVLDRLNNFENRTSAMFKPNLFLLGVIATATILVSSTGIQNTAFAHQRQLFTIGDKDYLFIVGSLNEPIFVDDKSGVDFAAYWPNATDPLNSDANGTRPIEGLEEMLKVEISAGNKNKTLDFEPAYGEPGNYEAPFFPTVETTYNYTLFGDINGTAFRATWTCNPAGAESEPMSDNSTVQISEGVTRKGLTGGFGCPQSKTDAGFPEPFMSNNEIVNKLEQLENATKTQ
ncbi:MAG TPA: hypothetical protein VFY64_07360 [Nitrososphaeraceae archaeon]|nr:hypothetical protein [Nitrososphaeraceae archaeon]